MPLAGGAGWNRPAPVSVDREAERLRVGVVLRGVVEELVEGVRIVPGADPLQVPAGEHPRARIDVGFDELSDADGEQFHDLAREIFLRARLRVRAAVEPHEHGGIFRHFEEQIAKVRKRVVAEELELAAQSGRMLDALRRHHPRGLRPSDACPPICCRPSRNGCARTAPSSPAAGAGVWTMRKSHRWRASLMTDDGDSGSPAANLASTSSAIRPKSTSSSMVAATPRWL